MAPARDPAARWGDRARTINALLGIWLFASVFVLPEESDAAFNTWTVGLFVFLMAVISYWLPQARFVNTALAAWLGATTTIFHHASTAAFLNGLAVAGAIFALSLVPGRPRFTTAREAPA
jgi:hypothetical protein